MSRTKWQSRAPLKFSRSIIAGLLLILIVLIFVSGCNSSTPIDKADMDVIRDISFSPDNKKLIFSRAKGGPTKLHVYDLESGVLSAYQSPDDELWQGGRYSFDGGKIIFETIPKIAGQFEREKVQLAIMDIDGKNIRKLTNSEGVKMFPSFSHDDKKVIFCKAKAVEGHKRISSVGFDLYEVDIKTGNETRLTWFRFDSMSPPYFFPDDKNIIFSAFGAPRMYPDLPENDRKTIQKRRCELEAKAKIVKGISSVGDNIYVIKREQKELPEPLIKSKYGGTAPLLTRDGKIFFEDIAYKKDGKGDGYQYFQYLIDGEHCRITNVNGPFIWSSAISPDGQFLVIVYGLDRMTSNKIVVYIVRDGSCKEIKLPDQTAKIINK